MKRKTLTLTICFLALVSIVSIGFASWVITKPVEEQVAQGSITAEAVEVEGYTLSVKWQNVGEGQNPKIHFGKPENYVDPAPDKIDWIKSDDESQVESLSCTLEINVSNLENVTTLKVSLKAIIENADKELNDETNAFGKALQAGYIAKPQIKVANKKAVDYDVEGGVIVESTDFTAVQDSKAGTCVVEIIFAWGSTFNGLNPIVHYNSGDYDPNAEAALNALKAIENEGISYKVVVGKAA